MGAGWSIRVCSAVAAVPAPATPRYVATHPSEHLPSAEQSQSQEAGIWQGNNLFNGCLVPIKTFTPVFCHIVPRAFSSTRTFSVMCSLKPFSASYQ